MARIAGVDLPRQKHINIALTYIYGIGHPRAGSILSEANVDPMKKVQDLSEEEVNRIRTVIEEQGLVEGEAIVVDGQLRVVPGRAVDIMQAAAGPAGGHGPKQTK